MCSISMAQALTRTLKAEYYLEIKKGEKYPDDAVNNKGPTNTTANAQLYCRISSQIFSVASHWLLMEGRYIGGSLSEPDWKGPATEAEMETTPSDVRG